jgi:hypothetical protein
MIFLPYRFPAAWNTAHFRNDEIIADMLKKCSVLCGLPAEHFQFCNPRYRPSKRISSFQQTTARPQVSPSANIQPLPIHRHSMFFPKHHQFQNESPQSRKTQAQRVRCRKGERIQPSTRLQESCCGRSKGSSWKSVRVWWKSAMEGPAMRGSEYKSYLISCNPLTTDLQCKSREARDTQDDRRTWRLWSCCEHR